MQYAIVDTFGAPQCDHAETAFENWEDLADYLDRRPDVSERIADGWAQIVEL